MKYLHWNQENITDFSVDKIETMYENGYVFTRIDKGVMQQTRSLRIVIANFELSSENKRILKKIPDLAIKILTLPLSDYDYSIGKIAKDFYETKFGRGIMSVQKVKEMLTDTEKSNFNLLLNFQDGSRSKNNKSDLGTGFAICYSSPSIIHYSYPFYDLNDCSKDMGLAMMVKAVQYAKNNGFKYLYLGSLQRPTDVYKLQFSGLEWFDGKIWNKDLIEAKKILALK